MIELYPGIENTEMFKTLKTCMDNQTNAKITNEFIYPDGSNGWFELSIESIPEGIFVLSSDITGQILANQELQKNLKKLQALREIDLAILGSTDLKIALKTVLRELSFQLNIDAADILLLNNNTRMLEYYIGYGFLSNGIEKAKLHIGEGYAGMAALEQKSFFIDDLKTIKDDFIRYPLIQHEGFVSYYVLPLIAKGIIIGVVDIFHRSLLKPSSDWIDFLEALVGQAAMAVENNILLNNLNRTNIELQLAYDSTIEGWSRALDLRDKETEGHTLRVTELTCNLAYKFDFSESEMIYIKYGALLHDIGKMGVPDAILLKPGKLTEEEFNIIKKHPTYAYELLHPIKYLRPALDIPYCHHEKWDGTGYPRGLKQDQIPLSARLFAIIDVWDALTSDRPYRDKWPKEKVLDYIDSLSENNLSRKQ